MKNLINFIMSLFGEPKRKETNPPEKRNCESTYKYPGYYNEMSGYSYDEIHNYDR